MRAVLLCIILVEDKEIRERYGKVFDLSFIAQMLLAIIDQTVETLFCLSYLSQLFKSKSLI